MIAAFYARAVGTMLVAFLALVTSASAECAWVLWDESSSSWHSYKTAEGNIPGGAPSAQGSSSEGLDIIGSAPIYNSCEAAQDEKINQMVRLWRKQKADEPPTFVFGKGGGGTYTINYEPGTNIISLSYKRVDEMTFYSHERHRYRCLPDTVDPRGPKGK